MKKHQKSAEIWGYFLKGGVRNFYLYSANMIVPTIIIVMQVLSPRMTDPIALTKPLDFSLNSMGYGVWFLPIKIFIGP